MATLLKQSTAETIEFGPFLDSADGDAEETGLSLVTADILVSKNHAALTAKNDATDPTGGSNAHYQVTLNSTDTGTLGRLRVWCHKTGALAVWEDFEVVPANVYDSLVAGSDVLTADVTQLGGVAQSLTDLKDFADDGYDPSTNKVQGVLLCDTVTALTGHTVQTGDNYGRLGAPAGASVSADVAAIKTDTGTTIPALLPSALVGGKMDSDMTAISGDSGAADALETMLDGTGGNTLSLGQLNIVASGNDHAIVAAGAGTGDGINVVGGASAGIGIRATGNTTGEGIRATGGANGDGLAVYGLGTGMGLRASAVGSGSDFKGDIDGSIGSLATQAKSDVNAEVDSALDTAIPGTPTADSINERIAAIDDLTQASGGGDLAAILVDTGTTLDGKIDTIDGIVDTILIDTANMQPKLGSPAGASMSVDIAAVKSDTAATLVDTGELQTDDVPGLIAALNDLSAAEVNAEVVDVLKTDTIAELAQAIPSATPTFEEAIMLPYMALRNKLDVDADNKEIHNNAGTVIAKKALSDDGTTYSEAEMAAGP